MEIDLFLTSYEKARQKASQAEETSNLETDDDTSLSRQPQSPARFHDDMDANADG